MLNWLKKRPQLLSIGDLQESYKERMQSERPIQRRRSVEIAVIDDEVFQPAEALRANQFQITILKDLSDIRMIDRFAIILCDLHGVGSQLNAIQQGAHLIREIKSNYPEKYVIAYTSTGQSPLLQAAFAVCDGYLSKDTRIEDWVSELDSAVDTLVNPVNVWKKYRVRLLDVGVTPSELAALEHAFVAAFNKGQIETKNRVEKTMTDLALSADVRAIINGLISSVIFKLLFP